MTKGGTMNARVIASGAGTLRDRAGRVAGVGTIILLAVLGLKDGVLVISSPFPVNLAHVALAVLVCLGVFRFASARRGERTGLSTVEWVLLGPALAGLVSALGSADPATSLAYSARLGVLWALAVVVSRFARHEPWTTGARAAFVAGGVVAAIVALLQWALPDLALGEYVLHSVSAAGDVHRPAAFYLDPNFLATHLVAAALIALSTGLGAADVRARAGWLAASGLMTGVVILTYSRSALIGLVVGAVVLLALAPARARRGAALVIGIAVLAGVLAVGPGRFADRLSTIVQLENMESNTTRWLMARSAIDMFIDHPVTGVGLEAFAEVYPEYRRHGALSRVTHPHQVPLPFVAETGVPGILALAGLVWLAARFARRRLTGTRELADVGLAAAGVSVIVGSLFQFLLYFEPAWALAGLVSARLASGDSTTHGT